MEGRVGKAVPSVEGRVGRDYLPVQGSHGASHCPVAGGVGSGMLAGTPAAGGSSWSTRITSPVHQSRNTGNRSVSWAERRGNSSQSDQIRQFRNQSTCFAMKPRRSVAKKHLLLSPVGVSTHAFSCSHTIALSEHSLAPEMRSTIHQHNFQVELRSFAWRRLKIHKWNMRQISNGTKPHTCLRWTETEPRGAWTQCALQGLGNSHETTRSPKMDS